MLQPDIQINNIQQNRIDKKYVSLTFNGNISYKIANILKQHYTISFKTPNTTTKQLINNKDKTDIMNHKGVYKLTCNSCNKIYIGRTYRNYKIRLSEHLRAMNPNSAITSHFASHLLEENHEFNIETGFKSLHFANKGSFLNNLETLEILRHKKLFPNEMLNQQLQVNDNPVYELFFQ